MSIKPTLKVLAWALAISFLFLNSGCGVLQKGTFTKDESGAYIRHYSSCGPQAIQNALYELDFQTNNTRSFTKTRAEISQEIQKNGNLRRFTLALFNRDAMWITWPAELEKYFNTKNYTLSNVDIDSLKKGDVAIVLVKHGTLKYHWVTYPTETIKKIKNFFGPKTKVIDVYLIKKRAAN